jgi:hypothetical protein
MSLHKLSLLAALSSLLLAVTGCKTPAEVKQALVSLDQGYADNAKLMQQYHELSQGFKDSHKYWTLYVRNRVLLDLALRWATTDPEAPPGVPEQRYADVSRTMLGTNVVSMVNQYRLKELPPRAGSDSREIFAQGTNTIQALIQVLPTLVDTLTQKTAAEYAGTVKNDSIAFDDYAAKVAALERINEAIERYLSIDVTVKPESIQSIAGSVRTLSGK